MAWTTQNELDFLFGGGVAAGLVNMSQERILACRIIAGKKRAGIDTILREYLQNLRVRRWTGCSVDIDMVEEAVENWLRAKAGGTTMRRDDILRSRGVIR